jgi:hypothetical protein
LSPTLSHLNKLESDYDSVWKRCEFAAHGRVVETAAIRSMKSRMAISDEKSHGNFARAVAGPVVGSLTMVADGSIVFLPRAPIAARGPPITLLFRKPG